MMDTLSIYRDDGILARAFHRFSLPVGAVAVALIGLAILVVTLISSENATDPTALFGVAVFVAAGLVSAAASPHDRIQWLVPPALRLGEYGIAAWLAFQGATAGSGWTIYLLMVIVAFHHYDIVYRLRHQRVPPPSWLTSAGGGWEGRIILLSVATVLDVLSPILLALAIWCGFLFVTESLVSWIRVARDERRELGQALEDEEDIFG